MTTSGTATLALQVDEVLQEAFERIGVTQPSGGDLRSGRRSLNLLLQELVNRGELLWATETYPITVLTATTTVTLPADTLSIADVTVKRTGTTDSEIALSPLGVSEYRQFPSKTTTGRPTSYVLNRERDTPTLTLWPVTDAGYDMVIERRRRLQDVTTYTETLDLPMRFLPAVIAGLAWSLADKRPGSVDAGRRAELLARYEDELDRAMLEDRERVSLFLSIDFDRG